MRSVSRSVSFFFALIYLSFTGVGSDRVAVGASPAKKITPRPSSVKRANPKSSSSVRRSVTTVAAGTLEREFRQPPKSARPWVYWFWLNGSITKEGITADLEAMARVGIGGALIMEVDQGIPLGPVGFMSDAWQKLFAHVVSEADRLGLEINMNNDAGWTGSGGPWVKPEHAMQKAVWTETPVQGPMRFDGELPKPPATAGHYREIAVLAYPTPAEFRIENIEGKAAFTRSSISPDMRDVPPGAVIPRGRVVDLSARMTPDGRLAWDVPEGNWTIARYGHTPTGQVNLPSPISGQGLECDKLSREAMDAHFDAMIGRLADAAGQKTGKTFVATHIDSWEVGSQNWSPGFRDDFRRLRNYDPVRYLPVMTGRVIDSIDVSERFLWDLRQTISELVNDHYAGRLAERAREKGMKLTIEAYGGPNDDISYAGRADEPMCEFWIGGSALETCREMSSAAHAYGKRIVGAEAFTAGSGERWLEHPASIKALGDLAFCEGVNRFVFHRYAMQPWLDRKPGMTMGPWGIHYERTQTWWNLTPEWHRYLSRCQHMLRQGRFVADIAHLMPEESPQAGRQVPRAGYDHDLVSPEVVLRRMSVLNGRLVLPDGMSYRVLALPAVTAMTPRLLRRVKELVDAGATVVGPRSNHSPSLAGAPESDEEVRALGDNLWGKGRIVANRTPEQVLALKGIPPDFQADRPLRAIHRATSGADLYFVAHRGRGSVTAVCSFRVTGRRPELWHPDTGKIERVAIYEERGGVTRLPIRFDPSGSVFVVFRTAGPKGDSVVRLRRDGRDVPLFRTSRLPIRVKRAVWGPAGDAARTKDVTEQVRRIVDAGADSFLVADLASGGDPAFMVVKTLRIEYEAGGRTMTAEATDPEIIVLDTPGGADLPAQLTFDTGGSIRAEATQPGRYEATTKSGRLIRFQGPSSVRSIAIEGPWEVAFPAGWGAPARITLPRLVSWSRHADSGVRHFSGTAVYRKSVVLPAAMIGKGRRITLDLGQVGVIARVKLNGKDLGVLWKPPYRIDVTGAMKAGVNALEIGVTNLWPNRMIGDEQLPEDSTRNNDGTLREWPEWVRQGRPSPTGRFTFTTWRLWDKDAALLESGLLGPVTFTGPVMK